MYVIVTRAPTGVPAGTDAMVRTRPARVNVVIGVPPTVTTRSLVTSASRV